MDKLEEVRQFLKAKGIYHTVDYTDVQERMVNELARQICSLFQPKPDHCNQHEKFNDECPWCHAVANEGIDWRKFNEPKPDSSRLLSDAEIKQILLEVADRYYDAEVDVTVSHTAVAKAQRDLTASIKDAEWNTKTNQATDIFLSAHKRKLADERVKILNYLAEQYPAITSWTFWEALKKGEMP